MGLFDNNEENRREEVVINTPEDKGSETRLKREVGSKLTDTDEDGSEVTLEDIHEQNKRIIQLLKDGEDESSENKENQGIRGGMDELL